MRLKLTLAYNGTHFFGSQTQTQTSNTILGKLEGVCKDISITSKIVASGRTDKAVHATGQVCHLDVPSFWNDIEKLQRVLNHKLPHSIQVTNIKTVEDAFHARYSAKKRSYRYIIKEGKSNPFETDFITFLEDVNFTSIEHNISLFIGEHDFEQFMKTGSDTKSSVREIYKAFAYKHKGYIILHFQANGFLRSQIRLMVGALLTLKEKEILERLKCKATKGLKPAPANGLYLSKITY